MGRRAVARSIGCGRGAGAGRPGRPAGCRCGTAGSAFSRSWFQSCLEARTNCGQLRSAISEMLPNMFETSARLLRLLSLLQQRREWTGAELAERLEITPRTVRRDVEKLRGLGYPINAAPGVAGGYQLAAGAALPPLQLDDDEAVAVAIGLRAATGGGVSNIAETSVRALAKLQQILPTRLRARVTMIEEATVTLARGGPAVDADVLVTVAAACRDHYR